MRTSIVLEEKIKLHRFAGISPEQSFTEAGRHREAVVAADQRMVIRCFRDDLAHVVHDVSHVPPPIQRAGLVDAPFWQHHEGRDGQLDAAEHLKGMAYREAGHAVVAYLLVEAADARAIPAHHQPITVMLDFAPARIPRILRRFGGPRHWTRPMSLCAAIGSEKSPHSGCEGYRNEATSDPPTSA